MDDRTIILLGAGGFGFLIGWLTYFLNRYRTGQVQFSDLITIIGILGGGVVVQLFKPESASFGAYGIGLVLGFMSYFLVLIALVAATKGVFTWAWFLDGRRKAPSGDEISPDIMDAGRPLVARPLVDNGGS